MRRILGIFAVLAGAASLLVVAPGAEEGESYEVRAIFDNASFLSPGMDVRIAGSNVGSVSELDVTFPGEAARADGSDEPGKAVVVMQIDDAGFQDFRQDATCLIHPQSLLGEKFVDCDPTQPRAPGSAAPPELEVIPDGERGEGQRLLPLEQNGKAVDLDLVNNIMREPYPDRFRLILNDLGAGLAARGDELEETIERSNPALRETNEVLETLARQNKALETLSQDSDTIMTELAAEKERVASFVNEATTVGEATLARRAELEETFERFPEFLRELRSTMTELRGFSDAATPVFGDLRVGAPALTRASEVLGPFSEAATTSFTTLGDAAEDAGPSLEAADPVVRQTRDLAQASKPAVGELSVLLSTLRQTGGFQRFLEMLYGIGGSVNAYDSLGHFARALIPTQNCFVYVASPQSGCESRFDLLLENFPTARAAAVERVLDFGSENSVDASTLDEPAAEGAADDAGEPADDAGEPADEEPTEPDAIEEPADEDDELAARGDNRSMRDVLEFMLGPSEGSRR